MAVHDCCGITGCPVEKQNLESICRYRNEAVFARDAKCEEYISTESMVANRGGITLASSAPLDGKVRRYRKGDVLVSNIRPYFKKIWHAGHDGACSNDVLVFEATKCDPNYLFWVLSSDAFFDYMMKTARGTKMPRGDKKAIMGYQVGLPPVDQQKAICEILESLQEKIALNNQLNGYLEELLFAKYDELFPAESEHDGTLADIGTVVGGATPSKKRAEYYCENGIGWITPRDLSNSSDRFIAQGAVDLTEEGYSSCSVKLLPAGSVLFSSRAPIGYVAIAAANVTTNQGFKSIVPKEEFGTAFVYCFLVRNKKKIADMGAGTTFPEVSGSMMRSVPLSLPSGQLCAEFSAFAHPILEQQRSLELENRNLCLLRDTLLPKLMSGKIDVSKVDLTQLNSHLVDC